MPAGHQMDMLVAKYVYGYTIWSHRDMAAAAIEVWKDQPGCTEFLQGFHAHREVDGSIVTKQLVQQYSTSRDTGWNILQMLRQHFVVLIEYQEKETYIVLHDDKHPGRAYIATATAPKTEAHEALAICRAALKAVGLTEVPDEN
jgi:hypothetical protein